MCSLCAYVNLSEDSSDVPFVLYQGMLAGLNRGEESFGVGFLKNDSLCVIKKMSEEIEDITYAGMLGFVRSIYRYFSGRATPSVGLQALLKEFEHATKNAPIDRGVAQTRYATRGVSDLRHTQPFLIKKNGHAGVRTQLITNQNGTVENAGELRRRYNLHYKTDSDTEVVGRIIASATDIETGIEKLNEEAIGSYNLILLEEDGAIDVYRDPSGRHPLWWAQARDRYAFASEDAQLFQIRCGPDMMPVFLDPQEVRPGELITIWDGDGKIDRKVIAQPDLDECSFEAFYFKRPASRHRGKHVGALRKDIGRLLGEMNNVFGDDVIVVPVLDSGRDYARGFADATGLPYVKAMMKTRAPRVYQWPEERMNGHGNGKKDHSVSREIKTKLKHTWIPYMIDGKRVIIVDDSIVRGTASRVLTREAYQCGAKEVHWFSGYPPVRFGCVGGALDHKNREKLVAAPYPIEKVHQYVAKEIGATSVTYAPLEELVKLIGPAHCWGCVTGQFKQGVPKEAEKAVLLGNGIS